MPSIWVPDWTQQGARSVAKAVREYDDRLGFGRNEETGQWVIFMRQGTTEESRGGDLPVLGFNELPTVDEAKEKLFRTDARRRGAEILDEINAHNETINRRFEDASSDASGETAEYFEWLFRKMGSHPRPRIFIPGGKNG